MSESLLGSHLICNGAYLWDAATDQSGGIWPINFKRGKAYQPILAREQLRHQGPLCDLMS